MVFTVLRFQPIRFAEEEWNEFCKSDDIQLVEPTFTKREEFIQELKDGKFKDVDFIARTFQSASISGNFDKEIVTLLNEYTNVKGIAHCGAGYDQIDAKSCSEFNIEVSNVPDKVSASTADTNLFLILATMRNFQLGHNNLMNGKWENDVNCASTPLGHSIQNKIVGILGMGGIGRDIRDRLKPFKFANIYYYNRKRLSEELEEGAIYMESIEKLFGKCDIICISIPLNKNTKHLINDETINMMKDGVILINTARGGVIDEKALKKALQNGKIKGFGSDVFDNEPNVDMELINMPQVTSLPHMGTHSFETMKAMEEFVVENVDQYLINGEVIAIVPELA